ncbi:hypothetical protein G6F63_015750 [Rhizopus arrhizus]|nr:hypothetical protein G6F63_015750 [Rhizopus arrhizus]
MPHWPSFAAKASLSGSGWRPWPTRDRADRSRLRSAETAPGMCPARYWPPPACGSASDDRASTTRTAVLAVARASTTRTPLPNAAARVATSTRVVHGRSIGFIALAPGGDAGCRGWPRSRPRCAGPASRIQGRGGCGRDE